MVPTQFIVPHTFRIHALSCEDIHTLSYLKNRQSIYVKARRKTHNQIMIPVATSYSVLSLRVRRSGRCDSCAPKRSWCIVHHSHQCIVIYRRRFIIPTNICADFLLIRKIIININLSPLNINYIFLT